MEIWVLPIAKNALEMPLKSEGIATQAKDLSRSLNLKGLEMPLKVKGLRPCSFCGLSCRRLAAWNALKKWRDCDSWSQGFFFASSSSWNALKKWRDCDLPILVFGFGFRLLEMPWKSGGIATPLFSFSNLFGQNLEMPLKVEGIATCSAGTPARFHLRLEMPWKSGGIAT